MILLVWAVAPCSLDLTVRFLDGAKVSRVKEQINRKVFSMEIYELCVFYVEIDI